MEIQIRPLETEDVPYLSVLLEELNYLQAETVKTSREEHASILEQRFYMQLGIGNRDVFVAEHESILGYIAVYWLEQVYLEQTECFVTDLFVAKMFQKQGITKKLLQFISKKAKERSCSLLHLQCERSEQASKLEIYSKCGWKEKKDLVIFKKDL
jgi:GNAT superfamily N-acetyltransferase